MHEEWTWRVVRGSCAGVSQGDARELRSAASCEVAGDGAAGQAATQEGMGATQVLERVAASIAGCVWEISRGIS